MQDKVRPHRFDLMRLEQGVSQASAPVERWNPPYCGDIGLAIRRDGTWQYRHSPINRSSLVKVFARVLRKDDDGRTYLVTPVEKVDVRVEDAPFLAVEMDVEQPGPGQVVVFRTNVDDVVRLGPQNPIRFEAERATGGLKPYVLVRGRLEALVTRALVADLVQHMVEQDDGSFGLFSGGLFWAVPS